MTRLTDTQLAEEMRQTMEETGWGAQADLVIDQTAARLSEGSDSAAEAYRVSLRRIWDRQFETWGAC